MSLRRSTRIKTKILEDEELKGTEVKHVENFLMEEIEKELESIHEDVLKPNELFTEDDVNGSKIYSFQISKKEGMIQKANLSCTPVVSRIPDKLPILKIVLKKSDVINLEENFKKASNREGNKGSIELVNFSKNESNINESDVESVSEDDEYIPTDDDNEESTSSQESSIENENDSNDNSMKEMPESTLAQGRMLHKPKQNKQSVMYHDSEDYHIKSDTYFEAQSEKIKTSNHRFRKLSNPKLSEEVLNQLLNNQDHISPVHKRCIRDLSNNCKESFMFWHFILEEGNNLLLYGLGSKRELIHDFHRTFSFDHPTIVINGFFPSITVKDILDGIIIELLESTPSGSILECVNLIEKAMKINPQDRLYLLIHNIDGLMLRSRKSQDILARLANIPNIRLIASIDHINASFIWDQINRWQLRFYWWDATTFLPYRAEVSYESSLLAQNNGVLALSSLHNVFRSLTSNAKSTYIILVKFQLENGNDKNYSGMLFKDLYRAAKEEFIASSDSALRSQLTEFLDHKLIRMKRKIDGAEYLSIPLQNSLLKQFLDEQEN